jgi:hypothetical protein
VCVCVCVCVRVCVCVCVRALFLVDWPGFFLLVEAVFCIGVLWYGWRGSWGLNDVGSG